MGKERFYRDRGDEGDEDDLNIYSDEVREEMLECDGIDPAEEAFMKGYGDAFH